MPFYPPSPVTQTTTFLTYPPPPTTTGEGDNAVTSYDWTTEHAVWMHFYAAKYSTFYQNRTRTFVQNNPIASVTMPYPQRHSTGNYQQYMSGKYPDLEGLFDKEDYKLKEQEMENSFTQGLGVMSYDHTETVLTPGARRSHQFDITLVARNSPEAWVINRIGRLFQSFMFPGTFTQSVLNMTHPPIWSWYVTLPEGTDEGCKLWDGDPLVSVLQSVDINHTPIQNIPFTTPDMLPLAVNIKLSFLELEPAMQYDYRIDGGLISRSERFKQFMDASNA